MYIAIYVSAIVLLCACAITFFILWGIRNKKRGEKLQQKAKEESPEILKNEERNRGLSAEAEKGDRKEEVLQNQDELENFSLEIENEKKELKKTFDLNPFSLDGGFTGGARGDKKQPQTTTFEDDDEQEDVLGGETDDDLDRKFKEYEEFLKRNLDLDDEDLEDNSPFDEENSSKQDEFRPISRHNPSKRYGSNDDMRALQNFDYESLKGKSEEEILEIIKNLPPKAQEILMSDILARRKFEDEE